MEKLYTEEQTLKLVKSAILDLCYHHGVTIMGGDGREVILSIRKGDQLLDECLT